MFSNNRALQQIFVSDSDRESAWAKEKAKEASDRESAWAKTPKGRQDSLIFEQNQNKQFDEARKVQATDLDRALTNQKRFAAAARGKGGTILTGPLGIPDSTTTSQVPGQKTILGL